MPMEGRERPVLPSVNDDWSANLRVDKIIKNAKIFTSNKEQPLATAIAVKDGTFAYVGDEAGLAGFEGEVCDLGGKFVMPAVIDSHVHVTMGAAFEYTDMGTPIQCASKAEALEYMAEYIRDNPGLKCYRFVLERKFLGSEDIVKEDLDAICPNGDLLIMEGEAHSVWVNSSFLKRLGITDDTPDPVPGLSYFVREDGHLTGNVFETAEMRFLLDGAADLTDEQLDAALVRWIDFCKEFGVSAVFDAGIPENNMLHKRIYARLREFDR